jgi:tetratricopeptide (TPR) repeat protein
VIEAPSGSRTRERWALPLLMLLAAAVALPSLSNGFAYDDIWIIVENPPLHGLEQWRSWWTAPYWPRGAPEMYRPLTTTLFALQWWIGGGSPWVFHAVSVLLHAAMTAAVWQLAAQCLAPRAALVAAALFAIHPVHVEAVANVVGQAELSAGLCIVVGVTWYLRARRRPTGMTTADALGLAALGVVGMLLKEHAVILPLVWLIAEGTLLRDAPRGGLRMRALLLASLVFVALFVWLRAQVLGGGGVPVAHPALSGLGLAERGLVMLGVVPELLRLLLWPARLHADYSPAHITTVATLDLSQLTGAVLVLAWLLVLAFTWTRARVVAFALLWLAVAWAPTANLVVASGVLLAERTLYVPSIAVVFVVAWGVEQLLARASTAGQQRLLMVPLGLVLIAGAFRSVDRAQVWRSSETVFWHLWREQPLSFKAHYAWSSVLFDRGDIAGGMRELQMAIRILPTYHRLHQDIGYRLYDVGRCDLALPAFERAVELGDGLPLARAGVVVCHLALTQFRAARDTAAAAFADGLDPTWFGAKQRYADSVLVALDSLPTPR